MLVPSSFQEGICDYYKIVDVTRWSVLTYNIHVSVVSFSEGNFDTWNGNGRDEYVTGRLGILKVDCCSIQSGVRQGDTIGSMTEYEPFIN
jgi:hypothetical protein